MSMKRGAKERKSLPTLDEPLAHIQRTIRKHSFSQIKHFSLSLYENNDSNYHPHPVTKPHTQTLACSESDCAKK